MNSTKQRLGILIACLSVLALTLAACGRGEDTPQPTATQPTESGSTGQAVFSVSDAAADMEAVSSIEVTIDSVQVQNEAGAWVTVSSEAETFSLLELRDSGAAQLLAEADLEAGRYNQMRLNVSSVTVVDSEGEHEAKLPSNTLQLKGTFNVKANSTATANFDFLADKSLHVTGEGSYVMAPVVLLETRSEANAQVNTDNRVQVSGGNVETNVEIGMNAEGNMDVGLQVTPDALLSISASGEVKQTKGQALASVTIKSVDEANGMVTVETPGGQELTLHLASDTQVSINGSSASKADLSSSAGSEATVQYNSETKAITSVSAGGSAESRARTSGTLNLSGEIVSVNEGEGTVTVATDSGAKVDLRVDSSSTLDLGGLVSGLSGLQSKVGTRVAATYDADTRTVAHMEGEASAQAQATVTGTLQSVNREAGSITIDSETSGQVTLSVDADTRLMADGQATTLAELSQHIGSRISAEYNAETKAATHISAEAKGEASVTASGTLKAVSSTAGTVTLAAEGGSDLMLNVTSNTRVMVDGSVSTLAALATHIGSQVTVDYNMETQVVSTIRAGSGSMSGSGSVSVSASGTLKSVNAVSNSVVIESQSGSELALKVTSQSQVLVNGASGSMSQLATEVGSSSQVEYNAETMTVVRLNLQ